jgi:bacterioferritin
MKGNSKFVEQLNRVLKQQLTAINQYFLHARMLGNWGFEKLDGHRYKASICAMKEADALIERILFLEGLPNLQSLAKLLIGEEPSECLANDLRFAAEAYRPALLEAIAQAEAGGDFVSRELLETFLQHCEEDIDWLETQQALIEAVSLPNYLQSKMDDDD